MRTSLPYQSEAFAALSGEEQLALERSWWDEAAEAALDDRCWDMVEGQRAPSLYFISGYVAHKRKVWPGETT